MAKLNIVGVGPGSADYVTPAARKTVQQAQLVIGAQRSINLFTNDVKGEKIVLTAKNLSECLKEAAKAVTSGKNVTLLSTGDPGFSGLLHTVQESELFSSPQINVIPGVSSIQACAAKLNLSWDNTRLFTFHEGQVTEDQKEELVSAHQCGRTIILLPDAKSFAPKDIAALLIETGADKQTPVYVCENLTLENERVTSISLEELQGQTFDSLSVMVIKQN
ncbi:MAG TPA: precorrin-6y C5,15-methyltransferase (decarboxylating) subunit CbiE [Candidatus Acidoferrales bacterium]|nr:precorrin-6y C5,15-methyltransferase (decarboxylating) subunit CbiE [Candidatus Acidoferrales bacterium]